MNETRELWMREALALAEQGRGAVEPNPLVGAVVVRAGQIVGRGWHQKFGGPHAEVHALAEAGAAARGADLYVTLEPCCHHGKTPPCTDAVIGAGIARVFAALEDPFPKVAGHGARLLRTAGVTVEFGLEESAARRQNAPYLKLLSSGSPYIHAKWAMSLDGKIATRTGASQWISNPRSREIVHSLRGRMDGILVGIATALADDPRLTARPAGPRLATRVVLDRRGRLPLESQLVRSAREIPVLVAVGNDASATQTAALEQAGCEVLTVAGLPELLAELGRRRWTNLLVEGGGAVLGSFADAGAIDEAHVFVAPILIGGASAPSPIGGLGFAALDESLRFSLAAVQTVEDDVYLRLVREVRS